MGYIEDTLRMREVTVYRTRIHWLAYLGALALLVCVMSLKILKLLRTHMVLTDSRIIGETGFFHRKHLALPYSQLNFVRTEQGMFGKLLDFGTLIISSKDGIEIKFPGISEISHVRMRIEEANEVAVLGHTLSQALDKAEKGML